MRPFIEYARVYTLYRNAYIHAYTHHIGFTICEPVGNVTRIAIQLNYTCDEADVSAYVEYYEE